MMSALYYTNKLQLTEITVWVLRGGVANKFFIVINLNRPGVKPKVYNVGDFANHYTTDTVILAN